ncbi:MAG TPA: RNA methyltransferase [Edaphobacter sp.]|nr:RNA methyltransferase [Edaphobacter sp.]
MEVASEAVSSRTNARVKQLRAAFAENHRLSAGLVAIEGEHLVEEALRSAIVPRTLFLAGDRLPPQNLPRKTEIVRLTASLFASVAETRSPQGIAALIEPPVHLLAPLLARETSPLLLIAVGLQDPGNLGTIIRSAEAFGASGVLITPGTVNPWNQKALRASVGSTFRTPVIATSKEEIAQLQSARNIHLFAAVGAAHGDVVAAHDANLRQPTGILIGNEGSGLAPEWLTLASSRITIPCPGPVESLNAAIAASLLLYEASRQRSSSTPQTVEANAPIPGPLRRRPTGATR